jgi:glycosyltransferase involved in cell wall biosynthesis
MPYQPVVEFSVLISCYFEEHSIEEFHSRLSRTLESMRRSYEILFVNDGSTDKTWEKLRAIFDADPHVTAIIDLFKNTGQANARTPAVMLSQGKAVVLIDSDLQLDPEELPRIVAKFDEGHDIVSGYRENRKDRLTRTLPSRLANPFKPWRAVPVIAMARRIAEVPVSHHPRRYGKSGWTFKKLFAHNMDNLVQLSQRPFQILAALCAFLALLFVSRLVAVQVLPFSILPRVTSGLVLNAVVLSLLIIVSVLCVIGEFVIRNFSALQRRPAFVIREIQEQLKRFMKHCHLAERYRVGDWGVVAPSLLGLVGDCPGQIGGDRHGKNF